MSTTHKIYLYATNEKPYPLSLSDDDGQLSTTKDGDKAFTTVAKTGDTLRWIINPESNIQKIDNVKFADPLEFLDGHPALANDGSGNWIATVKRGEGLVEGYTEYKITYTVNGVPFIQDPKLQIRKSKN